MHVANLAPNSCLALATVTMLTLARQVTEVFFGADNQEREHAFNVAGKGKTCSQKTAQIKSALPVMRV